MCKCSLYFNCEHIKITPFLFFVLFDFYTWSIPILPKIVVSLLKDVLLGLVALFVFFSRFYSLRSTFSPFFIFSLSILRTPLMILPLLFIFVLCPSFNCVRILKLFYSCLTFFSNLLFVTSRNLQFSLIRIHILKRTDERSMTIHIVF